MMLWYGCPNLMCGIEHPEGASYGSVSGPAFLQHIVHRRGCNVGKRLCAQPWFALTVCRQLHGVPARSETQ
jgi:hypothetical protein